MIFEASTAPAWIQAMCAIAGVVGLGIYAADTRQIRKDTNEQLNASQRPYLVLAVDKNDSGSEIPVIQNVGDGPIQDCYWKEGIDNQPEQVRSLGFPIWERLGPIAKGKPCKLVHAHYMSGRHAKVVPADGFRVHFCDMSGNWYWFTVTEHKGGQFNDFGKLADEEAHPHPFTRKTIAQRIEDWYDDDERPC